MFCISFHIAPEHSRHFDQQAFLEKVSSIRSPEIDAFEDKKQFHLSFHFFSEFPSELWSSLEATIFDDSDYSHQLSTICVITCEGEKEEDYWLIYHYDKNQPLDKLPQNLK